MPSPIKVGKFRISDHPNRSGTVSWRVTGRMPDGTRIRRNFSDEVDAIRERNDLEERAAGQTETHRALRTTFTPSQLADAEAAAQQAGSMKLSKIVARYLSLLDRVSAKGVNLDQAIAFVEARYRPETREITVFNAVSEFLESRVNISPKTLINYEHNLKELRESDPNKPVHAFTVSDIERLTARHTNLNTRKTLRRIFSIFFNWAVRHRYCLENPCDRLDKLPRDMSQIAALSIEETKRLLYASILWQDGSAASAIAIGVFAGLRPSEIKDLKPDDILKDKIRVTGGKLRRKLKRSVPIPPVLAQWLIEYPFKGLPRGWDYKMKKLKELTKAKKWVQDIIRHTSITFQTERDKNEALTAYNCGTSIQMMNRHYRDTIDDDVTVADFWNLTPAVILEKPPKINFPAIQGIEWPSKAMLRKLVWKKPLIHAAKDIGVSDVALKKRCVKVGIDLPPQGYWLKYPTRR